MRKSFPVTIALALAAYLALPMPGLSSSLQERIGHTQNLISGKRAREGVLTTEITGFDLRIRGLQGEINGLQAQENAIQRDLQRKRARLTYLRNQLQISQSRLASLRGQLATARSVLAARLVALYEDDPPDLVTVVLESNGFTDLLDRADFLERISRANDQVTARVQTLTGEVAVETRRLGRLEGEAQTAAGQVLARRNAIAGAKTALIGRRTELASARGGLAQARARIRSSRINLEGDLRGLERRQAIITARLQANVPGGLPAGPIKGGSGMFIWPVNGPVVSPFGQRTIGGRGEFHPGIDIAVPTGTPIRAAAAGTVTLEEPESASGGYGNFTCIQHTASISTCYAHQERFVVSSGAHVSQGQVIGISDCTGRCFGPHVHFEVRVNGSVVNPLNYL
jgi:peptidoglycan DL-endopeptidase CwlO